MKENYRTDMTEGPIFRKIIAFAVPVMLSGILQQLYNAADIVMVGQFVGPSALAAVGATSSLVHLIVNLFIGISIGTGIHVANAVGARDEERTSRLVHTSIALAIGCAVLVSLIGILFSHTFLALMGTPSDIIDLSALYMRIYFAGSVFFMLYTFGAAILRAMGDSRRPFIYLTLSGVINVALNYVLISFCGMGVDGVAWATVISQMISAVLVLCALIRMKGSCRLIPSRIRFCGREVRDIVCTGLPAGLQSVIFSLSNTVIQNAVNSFETAVIAGSSASSNIENFVYTAMNSFHTSTVTIVGQNVGAGKHHRIGRILFQSLGLVTLVGLTLGMLVYLLGEPLLAIYLPDAPASVAAGMQRLSIILPSYFLCGIMETLVGAVRGMGTTVPPMIVAVLSICGIRLGWIFIFFAAAPSLPMLFVSYPLSWLGNCIGQALVYILVKRRLMRRVHDT